MPRRPRLQYEGACYHVYGRGNRRKRIFFDDQDYREFESILFDQTFRNDVRLSAWCLMPNHYHLLIETPSANLAVFMQRLLTTYARYFNQRYGVVGHLFQGRYGARHCDKEAYWMQLVRYIHLNPYKAKRLAIPKDGWPWSSHRYYIHGDEPSVVAPWIHQVLRRFSEEVAQARRSYETFIGEGLADGTWDDFYQLKGRRFLGDDQFVQTTRALAQEPIRKNNGRIPKMALNDLLQLTENCLHVSLTDLQSASRRANISSARRAFVLIAQTFWRYPTTALAKFLRKDPSAISQIKKRFHGQKIKEVTLLEEALKTRG